MKSLRILVLVLCAATAASAGSREFHGVVRAIEKTYGVHHMRIPLLGVAMFLARPAGVSGLRLAVFENFEMPADPKDVTGLVENALGPDWHPFVRVRSRQDRETTLIYTNPSEGGMHMMIVNLESSEATVVELKVTERAIQKWLKEPGEEAEHSGHPHHRDDHSYD